MGFVFDVDDKGADSGVPPAVAAAVTSATVSEGFVMGSEVASCGSVTIDFAAVVSATVSEAFVMGSALATSGPVTTGAAALGSVVGGLVSGVSGKSGGDLSVLGEAGGVWCGVVSGGCRLVVVCRVT